MDPQDGSAGQSRAGSQEDVGDKKTKMGVPCTPCTTHRGEFCSDANGSGTEALRANRYFKGVDL